MHRHGTVAVIVVAAIPFLAGGCARPAFDAKAEEAKLLKRDAEWANAAAGKDVEKIVSYWTEDALVLPPGQPVLEGKAAVRGFVADSLKIPGFQIHWKSEKVVFSPDGKLAYMRGTNEMIVPGPDGVPRTLPGRGVTVWRQDADGQWRCVVDIWNAPPPPAEAAKS
jgi:ketosteroid isomerase-like protein